MEEDKEAILNWINSFDNIKNITSFFDLSNGHLIALILNEM